MNISHMALRRGTFAGPTALASMVTRRAMGCSVGACREARGQQGQVPACTLCAMQWPYKCHSASPTPRALLAPSEGTVINDVVLVKCLTELKGQESWSCRVTSGCVLSSSLLVLCSFFSIALCELRSSSDTAVDLLRGEGWKG